MYLAQNYWLPKGDVPLVRARDSPTRGFWTLVVNILKLGSNCLSLLTALTFTESDSTEIASIPRRYSILAWTP